MDTVSQKWGVNEKADWLSGQTIKRSYHDEVITKIHLLNGRFIVKQYGALSYDKARYPLYVVTTKHWDKSKPTVLITGGVQGYETSGVQSALFFLEHHAVKIQYHCRALYQPLGL